MHWSQKHPAQPGSRFRTAVWGRTVIKYTYNKKNTSQEVTGMKVRSLRWGYDGGGMACGPVSGSMVVEVCVTDKEGHFQRIGVSPMPLYDILIHMMHYDVKFDEEFAKYESNVIEDYDFEIGEEPKEMLQSRFAKVIHLARLAMQAYIDLDDDTVSEADAAEEFIEPYADRDVDEMDLPELEDIVDEDEWDEE